MKITPDELVTLLGRIREEEKHRASSILAERDQVLIQKLGEFRKAVSPLPDEECRRIYKILDELDPRNPVEYEKLKILYPTMFKGGPT